MFFLLLTNIKIKGKKKYIWISYGSDHNTLGIDSVSQLKEITSSVLRSPRFNVIETVPEILIDPRQWYK